MAILCYAGRINEASPSDNGWMKVIGLGFSDGKRPRSRLEPKTDGLDLVGCGQGAWPFCRRYRVRPDALLGLTVEPMAILGGRRGRKGWTMGLGR